MRGPVAIAELDQVVAADLEAHVAGDVDEVREAVGGDARRVERHRRQHGLERLGGGEVVELRLARPARDPVEQAPGDDLRAREHARRPAARRRMRCAQAAISSGPRSRSSHTRRSRQLGASACERVRAAAGRRCA